MLLIFSGCNGSSGGRSRGPITPFATSADNSADNSEVKTPVSTRVETLDLSGTWGGPHIHLRISGDRATLEYDCAHGTIDEIPRPNNRGQFTAIGVHVLEHGGPNWVDEVPNKYPVRYTGHTDGHAMTLTIVLIDTGEWVGTFSLVKGEPGEVVKCL